MKNDETKEKVQVAAEDEPGWDHLTNDLHLGLFCLLPEIWERCLRLAVCVTKLCKLVKTSRVRERRNIDCFDNCFAIAKETAPLVTMVSTSVLFYLQFSHRHHHGKNINTTKNPNILEKEKLTKAQGFY